MFYSDPPYHTRFRGLVNNAFTPHAVEQMRPHVQRMVDSLLDDAQTQGEMDAIHDLAHPLPILVISQMLGLPAEDARASSNGRTIYSQSWAVSPTRRSRWNVLRKVSAELTDYLTTLSHSRRKQPQNDLISALVGVVEEGQRLTQEELIANVTILLSAGHETTSNLIGNGLLALLRNPDQMQMLRDHPKLVASAVEEATSFGWSRSICIWSGLRKSQKTVANQVAGCLMAGTEQERNIGDEFLLRQPLAPLPQLRPARLSKSFR